MTTYHTPTAVFLDGVEFPVYPAPAGSASPVNVPIAVEDARPSVHPEQPDPRGSA